MTYHILQVSEPHPTRNGFTQRCFATVDVSMVGASWHWSLVDGYGKTVGALSAAFPSEDDAKNDAFTVLNGDRWE